MINRVLLVLTFTLVSLQLPASELKVGTGSESGTYYSMSLDVEDYCNEVLGVDRKDQPNVLVSLPSGGSLENLTGLKNKKFSLGWTQEDVLMFLSKSDETSFNQNRIKIVTGAHLETFHFVIPKKWKPKKGMLAKIVDFSDSGPVDITMLKDQSVGAWGGSLISLKEINQSLDLDIKVLEIPEDERTNPKMPFLLVAGSPSTKVDELTASGKYTLLPVQTNTNSNTYKPITVTYGGRTFPTIAVRALLVGKAFTKKSRNATMNSLATCISESLIDLADDPETDPNWQSVFELEDEGVASNWSYFEVE